MVVIDQLQGLVDLVHHRRELYVRFSDGPDADAHEASVDYESGLHLPGLSANRLNPPDWWSRPLTDWLARQVCQYAHLAERSESHRGWVLTGRLVDRGPDDEPLLTDVQPVAWLADRVLSQAENWYHEHFDPGRSEQ
ncbi:DUF6098 family protein [Actinopolymorpha sp. B11F2]|uniref:DUF6098 family protein n=1 Tax=Actinopolymorpha sp. B11F2 TaxID=3160862 RepID=UPI0032E4A239